MLSLAHLFMASSRQSYSFSKCGLKMDFSQLSLLVWLCLLSVLTDVILNFLTFFSFLSPHDPLFIFSFLFIHGPHSTWLLHSFHSSSSHYIFPPSLHALTCWLRGLWRLSWWTTHRTKAQLDKRTTSKAKYVLFNSRKYVSTVTHIYFSRPAIDSWKQNLWLCSRSKHPSLNVAGACGRE